MLQLYREGFLLFFFQKIIVFNYFSRPKLTQIVQFYLPS